MYDLLFSDKIIYLKEVDGVCLPYDYCVADGDGMVESMAYLTSAEWKALRKSIDNTYKQISDTEIDRLNKASLDARMKQREENRRETKKYKPKPGYVYLLEYDGLHKIGMTKNISSRLKQFGARMPHDVTLIHSVKTSDTVSLEVELHERYAEKRMNGEWFNLSPSDVHDIMNMEQA